MNEKVINLKTLRAVQYAGNVLKDIEKFPENVILDFEEADEFLKLFSDFSKAKKSLNEFLTKHDIEKV